jgi:hypothetical protein
MRPLHSFRPLTLLLLLLVGAASANAAVCAGTDAAPALCAPGAGPCVVSTSCSLPSSDVVVDLGARRLVIQANKTLTIPEPGRLTVVANGIELQPGAKIVAEGAGTPTVQLVSKSTTTGITMEPDSRIVAGSSGDGGTVDLRSDGPVVMRGVLRAVGPNAPDVGGNVSILARGNVTIEGTGSGIDVSSGIDGFGGYIDITAVDGGAVTVQSQLKLDGGDGGGLAVDADGTVDIKAGTLIDVDATLGGGYGGDVDITGRDVQVAATVQGEGKREDDGSNEPTYSGGDGAAVAITSFADLLVDGVFDLKGGPGGTGGDFDLDATGDITLLGKVMARAEGKYGSGSDSVTLWSESGDVTVGATVDAAGGWIGGTIDLSSFAEGGAVRVTGTANLSAAALDGLPADEQNGGSISLDACTVEIQSGAVLSTTGLRGVNLVRARTSMVIAGTLRAGLENRLEYRDAAGIIRILSPAGQIVPLAKQASNPGLTCCGAACVPPSTTTSSLPSTTTTSLPSTTTTSLPPATTTTSPPSTTTTSLPPATTTTSLPPTTTTSSSLPAETSTTTTSTSSSTLLTSTTVVTTSTTVESSTSTSTSAPVAPTSTTQPVEPACGADDTPFGAASCGVTRLTAQVDGATTDQLGGKATASRLRAFLRRANRFLDSARAGKDVGPNLRRAQREMKSFERTVEQGIRRKRRTIDGEVGSSILSLSTDARAEIGILQASSR